MKTNYSFYYALLGILLTGSQGTAQITGSLSRKEVIEMTLAHSYAIQNNNIESEKVTRDKQKAYQTFLPHVSVNSSYTHLNDAISMSVPPITLVIPGLPTLPPIILDPIVLQKQDILKTDVTAQMVLFTGLKVTYGTKALEHQQRAIGEMKQQLVSVAINETLQTYDRLAVIDQSDKVLDESARRLEKEAQFAKKALNQGLITPYDESKIEIARQELEAKRIELQTARNMTISKLTQLTGKPGSLFQSLAPTIEKWVTDTLNTDFTENPQIRALNEVLSATSYKRKSTISGYLPTVYAFGKKELITEDLSALDPEWAVGIGLKWSVFDGLQTYRDQQKARLDETMARNNLDAAEELLQLNMEKTRQDIELADQLINLANRKRITAAKGLQIAQKQYETGLGSITERLSAETDYQTAELELIQAIYRQRTAMAAFLDASGSLNIESIKD
ncbi:MAG TPA: TolC family protein [Bacteroidales bacterium]|nr:MAG: hypothetical protein A2X11_05085 [Bacteroidetes bacterium GWE2_42_24]OFY26606.1 MAG: hypothetical protein A2X09_03485 [Bacteroidetes bacterium GWF2_43_11]HAQ65962.1 TolC family protein [Bacteroidales bacterium]HBZ67488.1 TolC family protein [Bacteroidales bacterium]